MKNLKRYLIVVVLFLLPFYSFSQSMVSEITWTDSESTTYEGLLVLYPDNTGIFKVKFYNSVVGWVWVLQSAILTNRYDIYGNCTSFINCSYPRTSPNVGYSADNFLVYPNGTMYTQDYQGKWSTLIYATIIQQRYWKSKFREYGLD